MLLPLSLLVVCITSSEQQSFTMFQKCYSLLFIILKQQQAKKIYSLDILFVNENTDECTCICIWKMTMVLIVLSIMNDWNSKSLKMKYSVKKFWFLTKYCNLIKKKEDKNYNNIELHVIQDVKEIFFSYSINLE